MTDVHLKEGHTTRQHRDGTAWKETAGFSSRNPGALE
jgi:hypothetical protein